MVGLATAHLSSRASLGPPSADVRADLRCGSGVTGTREALEPEVQGLLDQMVGLTGFEPAASSSRTTRATKLRHSPRPETLYLSGYGALNRAHDAGLRAAGLRVKVSSVASG